MGRGRYAGKVGVNVTKVLHPGLRFVAKVAKMATGLSMGSLTYSSFSKLFPKITIG